MLLSFRGKESSVVLFSDFLFYSSSIRCHGRRSNISGWFPFDGWNDSFILLLLFSCFFISKFDVKPKKTWSKPERECFQRMSEVFTIRVTHVNLLGFANGRTLPKFSANANIWLVMQDHILRRMLSNFGTYEWFGQLAHLAYVTMTSSFCENTIMVLSIFISSRSMKSYISRVGLVPNSDGTYISLKKSR